MNNIGIIGEKCFGCTSCKFCCPKSAISFEYSKEGFLYPKIDPTKCIECGICLQKCPANNKQSSLKNQKYYGYSSINEETIKSSASGGIATDIARKIILDGGYVCGCILENKSVFHIVTNKLEDLPKISSSKYVQSDLKDCFPTINSLLNQEKKVLFIGTPCQVAGLKYYLGHSYNNLLTIDLVCHGVPSPLLFSYYLTFLEKKNSSKIVDFKFRYKKQNGWGLNYYYSFENQKKNRTGPLDYDIYGNDFLFHINYRESCYSCPFANYLHRPGDITIGDFWGVKSVNGISKDFFSNGVSSIIINSEKGKKIFDDCSVGQTVFSCKLSDVLREQQNLVEPTFRPNERNTYYDNFNKDIFFKKRKPKLTFKRKLGKYIPKSFKRFLHKFIR